MKDIIHERLVRKLNPGRFSGMSGKMAAIVGYILGVQFTEPQFSGLVITWDGFLMGRLEGDIGYNEFIGSEEDLCRNLENLVVAAELDPDEAAEFSALVDRRIGRFVG